MDVLRHRPGQFILRLRNDRIYSIAGHAVHKEILECFIGFCRRGGSLQSIFLSKRKSNAADFLKSCRIRNGADQVGIARLCIVNLFLQPAVDVALVDDVFQRRKVFCVFRLIFDPALPFCIRGNCLCLLFLLADFVIQPEMDRPQKCAHRILTFCSRRSYR